MALEIVDGRDHKQNISSSANTLQYIWYDIARTLFTKSTIHQPIYLCQCSRICNNGKKTVFTVTWKQPHAHTHKYIRIQIPVHQLKLLFLL